jgi:hypothetical protein
MKRPPLATDPERTAAAPATPVRPEGRAGREPSRPRRVVRLVVLKRLAIELAYREPPEA